MLIKFRYAIEHTIYHSTYSYFNKDKVLIKFRHAIELIFWNCCWLLLWFDKVLIKGRYAIELDGKLEVDKDLKDKVLIKGRYAIERKYNKKENDING